LQAEGHRFEPGQLHQFFSPSFLASRYLEPRNERVKTLLTL